MRIRLGECQRKVLYKCNSVYCRCLGYILDVWWLKNIAYFGKKNLPKEVDKVDPHRVIPVFMFRDDLILHPFAPRTLFIFFFSMTSIHFGVIRSWKNGGFACLSVNDVDPIRFSSQSLEFYMVSFSVPMFSGCFFQSVNALDLEELWLRAEREEKRESINSADWSEGKSIDVLIFIFLFFSSISSSLPTGFVTFVPLCPPQSGRI